MASIFKHGGQLSFFFNWSMYFSQRIVILWTKDRNLWVKPVYSLLFLISYKNSEKRDEMSSFEYTEEIYFASKNRGNVPTYFSVHQLYDTISYFPYSANLWIKFTSLSKKKHWNNRMIRYVTWVICYLLQFSYFFIIVSFLIYIVLR